MAGDGPGEVTRWLCALRDGVPGAADRLMPFVYDELHRLAAGCMAAEQTGHTLQPTALVHEAYLKLVGQHSAGFQDRATFFGVTAKVMRRVLVDHARARRAAKRGGDGRRVPLDDLVDGLEGRSADVVAVDAALTDLSALDPPKARVVELRFFAGLSVRETAEVLGDSVRSVERHWTLAKAWLHGELTRG